jgi:hypothetical protein
MLQHRIKKTQPRRGGVTPLVALVMVFLLPIILALAVDGGLLLTERRHAQATADAAAMAAACVLYDNYPVDQGQGSIGDPVAAALGVASANGYTNDGTTSAVTVNIPPASGPYAGLAGYVEVLVTYYQPRTFASFLGYGTMPVQARAVARGAWTKPNFGILVLNYPGQGTLDTQGSDGSTGLGTKVIINSSSSTTVLDTGSGTMTATEFDIGGGYAITGNGQLQTNPTPNNIITNVHPTPDPLAYLPSPTQPDAANVTTSGNIVQPTSTNAPYTLPNGTTNTYNRIFNLSPGSYGGAGQPQLPTFATGDLVIFQQASAGSNGIYYLTEGGFNAAGADLILDQNSSGGIMFYNAGDETADAINLAADPNGYINLSAPSNGIYKGLLMFQARNAPQDVQITGDGSFTLLGTIYAPNSRLKVVGNGAYSAIGSQYIVQDLAISGNGYVRVRYHSGVVARARFLTLVE